MTTDDLGFLDRSDDVDALAAAFLAHVEQGLGSYDEASGAMRVYAMTQVMTAYYQSANWQEERDRRKR